MNSGSIGSMIDLGEDLLSLVDKLNKIRRLASCAIAAAQTDRLTKLERNRSGKDVDGPCGENVGSSPWQDALVACTPVGSVMSQDTLASLKGLEAVVNRRSYVGRKPVAQLLLAENAPSPSPIPRPGIFPASCAARFVIARSGGLRW